MNEYNKEFWKALDELVSKSEVIIDRPKGTVHPKFPDFVYKVDYGYLKDTSSNAMSPFTSFSSTASGLSSISGSISMISLNLSNPV